MEWDVGARTNEIDTSNVYTKNQLPNYEELVTKATLRQIF